MKIIINENGTKRKNVDVNKIEIPDLWHVAMAIPDKISQNAIIEVLHLAHDMRGALRNIAAGADINKPIHTK